MTKSSITAIITLLIGGASTAISADISFQDDVLPLLQEHCLDCHGRDSAESELRLDSVLAALRGGDSGESIIVPGRSDVSHLIERVTSNDPETRMPPDAEYSCHGW